MRQSYQRQVILEELQRVKTHPRAAEVYELVKKRIPNISFGTVYRNLRLLRDQELVQELTLGKEASRWDGNTEPHYHFTCEECGKVVDLSLEVQRQWERVVEEATGFLVTGHRAEFYGLCRHSRQRRD